MFWIGGFKTLHMLPETPVIASVCLVDSLFQYQTTTEISSHGKRYLRECQKRNTLTLRQLLGLKLVVILLPLIV